MKDFIMKFKTFFTKNNLIKGLFGLLLIGFIATSYFSYQYFRTNKKTEQNNQVEVTKLVEKISKFVVLPSDQTPTLATVADPELLKDQPFFANAQKGDKVLIYAGTVKKAILYRPSLNKIIDITTISTDAVTPKK